MGLPEILIEFKQRAETAVRRSENGIVAVILADDTKTGAGYESLSTHPPQTWTQASGQR